MAIVDVDCSECGATLQLDDALMGTSMTCPKCKLPFVVEPAGAYGLVDDPPKRSGRSGQSSPDASPQETSETDEQRRIREQMERWSQDD